MGAPSSRILEMWETTNPNPSLSTQHENRVPHDPSHCEIGETTNSNPSPSTQQTPKCSGPGSISQARCRRTCDLSNATAAGFAAVAAPAHPARRRERELPALAESAWAAAPASAWCRPDSSFAAPCASSQQSSREAFFFFLGAAVPFCSKGADCVCRSATSAASGGAGVIASPGVPRVLAPLGRARASLNRVFLVGAVGSSGFAGCSVGGSRLRQRTGVFRGRIRRCRGQRFARRLAVTNLLFLAGLFRALFALLALLC